MSALKYFVLTRLSLFCNFLGPQQQPGNTKKGKPIKFNGEFDFESSNARFDKDKIESELKSEIEKMKISAQDEEVGLLCGNTKFDLNRLSAKHC
jgi:hypothetical protein